MNEIVPIMTETKTETVVYASDGSEIERLEGIVSIRPKDYEKHLPVEYRHIKTTTQTLNIIKVEKA